MIFIHYSAFMYARHITTRVREALADTPVVVLNGARQVGKSTLAQQLAVEQRRRYVTLDEGSMLSAAAADPSGFLEGLHGPLVLDEVQRVPELFLSIKYAVDQNRAPGRFLLTGSANVLLIPDIADSLAGRMEVLSLWPLSAAELTGASEFNRADWLFDGPLEEIDIEPVDRKDLHERLAIGGFPEAVARSTPRRRAAWFSNYIDAVMHRDVRDLAHLEQLSEVPHLLALIANRSGSLLNFAELSRSTGLAQTTLKRYFNLLETLFLVVRLQAWGRNPAKRLVKSPKMFVPDSGLLAHLLAPGSGTPEEPPWLGSWVETFVLAELRKHLAFSDRGLTLWHYRTQSGIEVDLLLEGADGRLTGVEVKAAASVTARDFKGLQHLRDTEPDRFQRGIVLYCGREVIPFRHDLFAVPISCWWSSDQVPHLGARRYP